MARKKKSEEKSDGGKRIRVRLDYRTIITIKDMSVLNMWREKYPDLQVLPA